MKGTFVLRNAHVAGATVDVALGDGKIVAVARHLESDAPSLDCGGKLLAPGFVESHLHLDKALMLDRLVCRHGTLNEAMTLTSQHKADFTHEDIYERASRTLRMAIGHGTTHVRAHVEVDPGIGMLGFEAVRAAAGDHCWGIDVQLCVFPQEGLLDNPGTEELLREGLRRGAEAIGAVPYVESKPRAQIDKIFEIAREFDVDIDMHLDFFDNADVLDVEYVCRLTETFGWGGRVTVGHETALAHADPTTFARIVKLLASTGVAVTVIPATDQYLQGSLLAAHLLMDAGILCAIATNNVQNAFTPFGDASLLRVANLYANLARIGAHHRLRQAFEMITTGPARQLHLDGYGLAVGCAADLVVLDAPSAELAVASNAPALYGFKAGRLSFAREPVKLFAPSPALAP